MFHETSLISAVKITQIFKFFLLSYSCWLSCYCGWGFLWSLSSSLRTKRCWDEEDNSTPEFLQCWSRIDFGKSNVKIWNFIPAATWLSIWIERTASFSESKKESVITVKCSCPSFFTFLVQHDGNKGCRDHGFELMTQFVVQLWFWMSISHSIFFLLWISAIIFTDPKEEEKTTLY